MHAQELNQALKCQKLVKKFTSGEKWSTEDNIIYIKDLVFDLSLLNLFYIGDQ